MLQLRLRPIDLTLERGEQLALTVTCPSCAAKAGESCQPYTHWIRVRDALLALPSPVEENV